MDSRIVQYKNIQERLGNQNKKGDSMATIQVIREMLDVLDTYDRAFGAVTPETDEEKATEAEYKATYDEIVNTFENLGVSVIETVGKEFDYEYHQAVMQKPTEEYEEGLVCEEFQKGFVLGDTLIRASMVAVAM
jgi:molecular chaperone GrpE